MVVPHQRGTLHDDDDDETKVENAVLVLEKFSAAPWVRFGQVLLGGLAVGSIQFVNNTDNEETVAVDKIGHSLQIDQTVFRVPPHSNSVTAMVSWTPDQIGGFRDSIHFKFGRGHLRVIAYGVGMQRKKAPVKKVIFLISSLISLFFLFLLLPDISFSFLRHHTQPRVSVPHNKHTTPPLLIQQNQIRKK